MSIDLETIEIMNKSVVLADCEAYKIESFLNGMRDEGIDVEGLCINSIGARDKFYSNFLRYFKYFSAPIIALFRRRQYEYIVGWQQFYALIFCFWCQLFHLKKYNKVIVVNFTYKDKKGIIGKIYKWFMRKCVCNDYVDYLHVPSYDYAEKISKAFGISPQKMIITTFGIDDYAERYGKLERPSRAPEDYTLSIGRSNRDYDFLIDVWKGIDKNLVIISDEYKRNDLPPNVLLINDVAGVAQHPWLSNCNALIIPIDKVGICSGDTVLLSAMSYSKTIFVTNPSTLAEMYVQDGVNAIYINKNVEETRKKICDFFSDDQENAIGQQARKDFLEKYSRRVMGRKIASYMK